MISVDFLKKNTQYKSTSALIVQSHDDRGISALIVNSVTDIDQPDE